MNISKDEKIKYSDIVSSVVDDGLYFKDAMDWYFLKYSDAASDRTYFVLLSFLSFLIVLFLYFTIDNILPIKETFPVLIKHGNSVDYYPRIEPVKPKNLDYTSNESILRFLLINYVREFFNHDYRSGDINKLNEKLSRIKNYSTDEVYSNFREYFNKVSSEIFNRQIYQFVAVKTFRFISSKNGKRKISSYIFSSIPTDAEIDYIKYYNDADGTKKVNGTIYLTFRFEQIKYNAINGEFTKPKLVVTNYIIEEK